VTSPLAAAGNAAVLLELGRLDEAAGWCDRAEEATRQGTGFRISVAMGYHPRGVLAFRRGDAEEASAIFTRLEAMAHQHGIADPCFIPWAGDAIAAYLACGREADARRVIAAVQARAGTFPACWPKAVAAAGGAALAGRVGDRQAARQHFSQALAFLEQAAMPVYKAQVLTDYGSFLCRDGEPRNARPVLAEALRVAEDCGAAWHADRARVEWRRAGGRSGTTPAGQLTPQEAAVARLARAGKTNKEIAAQLYLSVNTVETHLAHAYQKLGISRRWQLPALPGGSRQPGQREKPS
jgi:DNA-binding CsgD family transcriptional regulator